MGFDLFVCGCKKEKIREWTKQMQRFWDCLICKFVADALCQFLLHKRRGTKEKVRHSFRIDSTGQRPLFKI